MSPENRGAPKSAGRKRPLVEIATKYGPVVVRGFTTPTAGLVVTPTVEAEFWAPDGARLEKPSWEIRRDEWVLTHQASGRGLLYGFQTVKAASAAAEEIGSLADWSLDLVAWNKQRKQHTGLGRVVRRIGASHGGWRSV